MDFEVRVLLGSVIILQGTSVESSHHLSHSNSNTTALEHLARNPVYARFQEVIDAGNETTVAGIVLGILFTLGIIVATGICIVIFCCKSKSGGSRLVSHTDNNVSPTSTTVFISNSNPLSPGSSPVHIQGPPPYQSLYPGTPPHITTRPQSLPNSPPPAYSET
ncbi:cysteine and tyrosine-rich protein 1-like [Ostrea edulis]|uniref:cysteine and tyrosine-rich protein 1-like n=1 Tax=Ostrea edulis TaxID=37623 RepID=UPI00209410CB|nr:cysteine and tyrosine-rich protein 1-like [Ostrea edulis]